MNEQKRGASRERSPGQANNFYHIAYGTRRRSREEERGGKKRGRKEGT